jgi:hypothetical protein
MRRIVDIFVDVTKSGRPNWSTLIVRLRSLPKHKRERKKFIRPEAGSPINRTRRTVKDGIRRPSCDDNAT